MEKNTFKILTLKYTILGWIFLFGIYLFAKEDFKIYSINIPEELKDLELSKYLVTEDINQDGLLDLIFIINNKIYISEQKSAGEFSEFIDLSINISGAIDFGDIVPGGEKEILVMHKNGISYFYKEFGKWTSIPIPLIKEQTIYDQHNSIALKREHFAIDLDGDGISELVLWGKAAIHFYYRDNNDYKLMQIVPYECKEYITYPGLIVANSPLALVFLKDSKYLFKNDWPVNVKYLYFSTTQISNIYLIKDFNNDSKKDLIQIKSTEKQDLKKGNYSTYEYLVHFLNDKDKKFSQIPNKIINDSYGTLLSPDCVDIDNNGFLDILRLEIETERELLKKQKLRLFLFLSDENGNYPNEPSQIIETLDYPVGREMLVDINGDKKKDLILIHPITGGFSLGTIVNRFLQKGLNAEIRIFLFKPKIGFSMREAIRKNIKIRYTPRMVDIPISLSGDFNGDGMKDLLIIDMDKIKIFPLTDLIKGFTKNPKFDINIENQKNYLIKDINKDGKSDLIIFCDDYIKIIFF
jgi:hypothetical protein